MNASIRKGDEVLVMVGKDKGKLGKVLRTIREKDQLVVEGINKVKRHTKPTAANQAGGIVEKELPIHISNVAMRDPKTAKPTRLGKKQVKAKDGSLKWVRFAKKSGELLD